MNCFQAPTYRQLFMLAADAGVKLEQAALLRSCCSAIPYPFRVVVAGNRRLCAVGSASMSINIFHMFIGVFRDALHNLSRQGSVRLHQISLGRGLS